MTNTNAVVSFIYHFIPNIKLAVKYLQIINVFFI